LADRLEQVLFHTRLAEEEKATIEGSAMFFLATADRYGRPDCSYKGGLPGFVRVVDEITLAFPDYNGNGMFRSLGNILVNPSVGLLFIDFEHPTRLRVNGTATMRDDDPLLGDYREAQVIIRVNVERIFSNCPRYIHKMNVEKHSVYIPQVGHSPPVPSWKKWDEVRDVLPEYESKPKPDLHTYVRRLERHSHVLRWCIQALRKARYKVY
jgi:uncharacterized protein